MKRIDKIILILFILIILLLNSGCVFEDALPELKKLKFYSPEYVEFQKTSADAFKKSLSDLKPSDIEVYSDGNLIIKLKPPVSDVYSSVRVGFKNNLLDWIEFNLANNINISKFVGVYGNPTDINTNASNDLDYYNYEFFNISADKNTKLAKGVTYFSKSPYEDSEALSKNIEIPISRKKKFYEQFINIEPGITTESEFTKDYPNLIPYEENNSVTNSIYVLTDELGDSRYYYDRAILKFESGLLTWINLIPKNLPVSDCLKSINTAYKKENVDALYELYDFSNFILIVDKKSKMVKSIGVFSRDVKL